MKEAAAPPRGGRSMKRHQPVSASIRQYQTISDNIAARPLSATYRIIIVDASVITLA